MGGATATGSALTFSGNTAADQSCSATDNINVYGTVSGYSYVNAPTQLAFGQQPTNTSPNTALSPAITVRVLDPCGNLFTSSTATVTLTLNNANGATLSGNTVNAVGGIATFSNLKVSQAGTGYTLTASSGSLTSATSTAFNIACQSITVTPAAGALAAGTVGTPYSQQFSQTGITGAVMWSINPAIPGLSLDSTGKLSGTPTAANTYFFTITATDGNGCPGSTTYSLTINCPMLTLPTTTLPVGTYNSAYPATQLTPTGGSAPYSFTVSGLPSGMTRTPSVGNTGTSLTIGGTPTQTGDFTVQVTVTDAYGCASAQQSYALKINKITPIITWNPPAFLPSGLLSASVLNATANIPGSFSYTPNAGTILTPGFVTLTANFTPSDAQNYSPVSQSVTIPVLDNSCGTTVNPAVMPAATRGTPFVQTLSGSPTGSYVFSVLSGTLPPGLSIVNVLGVYSLRGTPSMAGTYTFTIKASKNGSTCAGARTYTMVVP